jgi:hypothetical protein
LARRHADIRFALSACRPLSFALQAGREGRVAVVCRERRVDGG